MNTPIDRNDPRLMDFVLGELEEGESRALAHALQDPVNADARAEVEELRDLVRLTNTALRQESESEQSMLTPSGRNAIRTAAQGRNGGNVGVAYRWMALAATLLLCLGGIWLYMSMFSPEATLQQALRQAEREEIAALESRLERLGEGWERFFITDINNPQASAMAQAPDLTDPTTRTEIERALDALEGGGTGRLQQLRSTEVLPAPAAEPYSGRSEQDVHIRNGRNATTQPGERDTPPIASPAPLTEKTQTQSVSVGGSEAGEDFFEHEMWDELATQTLSQQTVLGGPVSLSEIPPPTTRPYFEQRDQDVHIPTPTVSALDDKANRRQMAGDAPTPPPMGMPIIPPPDRRPYPGGEQYSVIEERSFASAAEQPLSTFSLHPDGAAYANIRRMLQQGQLPPPDAVRIEEIINYFDYDYPQPMGEHPFSVNIEIGLCPWASGHFLAKIGLQGRDVPREERPPANLVFLIDTSGSMNRPNRLPLVKESLKALLEQLDDRDRVGIVTYAGQSLTTLESTSVSQRDRIVRAIDGLRAAGSTHGSAGIQDAYAMAQQHFIEDGINRVILATDGDFNVGVTSREGLLALIEEKRRTGVFLTVLGYGMGNLKDGTLELLATKGNGNYAYIDDYAEARRVLVEQLTGTLMTIAKDARIQVEFNPAQVRSYRLLGYENRLMAHRDFHDDAKDAGEIGAGHTVTALYQIVPHGVALDPGVDALRYQTPEPAPPIDDHGSNELMFVKLRYKQPDSETSRLIEIPVPAQALSPDNNTTDFRFAAAAAGFGLLLRDSAYKGDATFDLMRRLAAAAVNNNHRREELVNLIVTAKTLRGQ